MRKVPGTIAMQRAKTSFEWHKQRATTLAVILACVCLGALLPAAMQSAAFAEDAAPASRLLSEKEGRAIVKIAWKLQPVASAQDCSHLIHQIYQSAGFDYPYQNSFDLYSGGEKFARVKSPHAGDLVVWPGHVGLVVNPSQHSFYSLVRTGLEEQDYEGPYWRSRGTPRFYRYRIDSSAVMNVAAKHATATDPEERSAPDAAPTAAAPPATVPRAESAAPAYPASIVISAAKKLPTRDEVAASISALAAANANAVAADEPSKIQMPVVIVAQIAVNRLELKRDHGWAYVQISSVGSISGGQFHPDRRDEEVRWQLHRSKSSWEALRANRSCLRAARCRNQKSSRAARAPNRHGAAARDRKVIQQESQLANLLAALLAGK